MKRTFTHEEMTRLVPEATNIMHGISMVHCTIDGVQLYFPLSVFNLLVATRYQLEIARKAFSDIKQLALVDKSCSLEAQGWTELEIERYSGRADAEEIVIKALLEIEASK